jgi:hypothetical protein
MVCVNIGIWSVYKIGVLSVCSLYEGCVSSALAPVGQVWRVSMWSVSVVSRIYTTNILYTLECLHGTELHYIDPLPGGCTLNHIHSRQCVHVAVYTLVCTLYIKNATHCLHTLYCNSLSIVCTLW